MSTRTMQVDNPFNVEYTDPDAPEQTTGEEGDGYKAIETAVHNFATYQDDMERKLMNEYARQEDLAEAVVSQSPWIRVAVAQNPSLSKEALSALARDEDFVVILKVLLNPSTPREALEYLSTYSHEDARENVKRSNISRLALARIEVNKRPRASVSV